MAISYCFYLTSLPVQPNALAICMHALLTRKTQSIFGLSSLQLDETVPPLKHLHAIFLNECSFQKPYNAYKKGGTQLFTFLHGLKADVVTAL